MIAVIDYKMGNLGSVAKALAYLGADVVITSDAKQIRDAAAVILPGVGAMSYARDQLARTGLDEAVARYVRGGRPFLGICLGMQLMFQGSEEGDADGLGILPGHVRRIADKPDLKIPHMGWNRLETSCDRLLERNQYYYFVHSYVCQPDAADLVAAQVWHGEYFAAAVRRENILLTQFHPEKSGTAGLVMLRRWLDEEVCVQ